MCMNQHVNYFFCQSLVPVILDGNNTLMTFWSISSILIQINVLHLYLPKRPLQFLVSKSKREKWTFTSNWTAFKNYHSNVLYILYWHRWEMSVLSLKFKKKKEREFFYFTHLSHLEIKSELFLYHTIHKLAS